VRRHPGIVRARLVVDHSGGNDRMTLHVEAAPGSLQADDVVRTIREVTKLRGEVSLCAPGELPNDGKVIDDIRKYD
jgi:phenylacetate-CoA ligase